MIQIRFSNTISDNFFSNSKYILFKGNCLELLKDIPNNFIDLTITSPPYFMGKEYDKSRNLSDFVKEHKLILPEIIRITKEGGSICWQLGYHVKNSVISPLDYYIYSIISEFKEILLRNRIIWTFGHGYHNKKRFSGRHEIILWFTKGKEYYFDLDSVRIKQKYPGKKYYKGNKKGEFSSNPLGKNPSDVWDIPNVKANHIEKTEHPCQFPVALATRLIKSLSPSGGFVLDPYMGSGSTAVASILEKRGFIGAEIENKYYRIAKDRCQNAFQDKIKIRPLEREIFVPLPNMAVAKDPFINYGNNNGKV